MKCSIDGCPGEYEAEKVMHTVRHRGQVTVIDHVPADVCSVCGDVLLEPDTVRRIEPCFKKGRNRQVQCPYTSSRKEQTPDK